MFQKLVSIGDKLSIEEQIQVCRAYTFHTFLNRHELCSTNCSCNITIIFDMEVQEDRVKISKILLYFYELSWVIHCYQYKRRTQKLESNHRSMLIYAPKHLDFRETYCGRVDLALAQQNDGTLAIIRTMEDSGSKCDDIVMEEMNKLTERKKKQKNIKRYKIDRVKWNLGISTIHAISHKWTYKGDDGLTKRQKNIIKKRKVEGSIEEEPPLKKSRIKHNHDDKCTGGDCEKKFPNAKSKCCSIHR
jgi:hypothetical protein